MKIILHFAIILDYRPFNIVGKLQIWSFNISVCTLI